MKKKYLIPTLETVKVQTAGVICVSGPEATSIGGNASLSLGQDCSSDVAASSGGRSTEFGGGLWDDTDE